MVEQLSVFLQNESGKIASITRTLADEHIDIRALSIADTTDFGILRMLVDDTERAKAVLKEKGYFVKGTEVIVIAVPDVPGGLAGILELMANDGINIEYMYSFLGRDQAKAYMIFRLEDEEKFLSLLSRIGITVVTKEELGL